MEEQQLHLGRVVGLEAESFGEPGSRTFRVRATTGVGAVTLWLEKEQIVGLARAVTEVLERVDADGNESQPVPLDDRFSGELEVRVGVLAVGYNPSDAAFLLEATEFEPPLSFTHIDLTADRTQLQSMLAQLQTIVNAGRPRCVLCGMALSGEPHFCPPSNGHAHVAFDA